MMRIAISTLTTTGQALGVGRYIASLIDALQAIDQTNDYLIYTSNDNHRLFDLHQENFKEIRTGFTHSPRLIMRPAYFAWQNSWFLAALRRQQVDVLHLPNLLPLFINALPTVVTIHDLGEFKVANKYGAVRLWYRQQVMPITVRQARRVVAVSQNTKRDLVDILHVPADKIDVTYEGASDRLALTAEEAGDCLNRIGRYVDGPYLFYTGAMHPHKNLERLIRGFHRARQTHQFPHKLVLGGKPIGQFERLQAVVQALGLNDIVLFPGFVPDADLACLYHQATAVAYIPLNEGFGLPVLEAMAAGAPVLAANSSSIPEVAGDAALLVDPLDEAAIATGIQRILTDSTLRDTLRQRGFARVKLFSWRQCAELTLESYRRANEDGK